MKTNKLFIFAILFFPLLILGIILTAIDKNNISLVLIGHYFIGIANLSLGIIGLIGTKERKYWPFFIVLLLDGIAEILINTRILF